MKLLQISEIMKKVNLLVTVVLLLFSLLIGQSCGPNSVDPAGQINISTTSGNIETVAGLGPSNFDYSGDGNLATLAKLGWITGICIDASNNVYISDGASNTIRKISASTGLINTIAGTFIGFNAIDPTPFAGDGGAATSAHLNVPLSVSVDESGNVIVIDAGNNVVRKITLSDGEIYSIVGTRGQGYTGDDGLAIAATLFNPHSIGTDGTGNIYLAESGNNVIRMISKSSGKITTIAGLGPDQPGYTGDNGAATNATLNSPTGIAVDALGNVYISDGGNNVIRKISAGIITTLAGNGNEGFTGDGGNAKAATFHSLRGLAVDATGNVYIADSGNNAIRKIDSSTGKISTLAGTGVAGYTGDGYSATKAKLSNPLGVAIDTNGNIFIADTGNSAVRVVTK